MAGKQPKRNPRPGVDEYGRTPLHYAASDGDLSTLVSLLDSGADIDAQDDNGWTALHFAAQSNHCTVGAGLLKRNANPNLLDSHGNGPLWVAVMNARGSYELVRNLLEAGANPDQKNRHGRSPRDMANTIGFAQDIPL